jgi:hypothetical protein
VGLYIYSPSLNSTRIWQVGEWLSTLCYYHVMCVCYSTQSQWGGQELPVHVLTGTAHLAVAEILERCLLRRRAVWTVQAPHAHQVSIASSIRSGMCALCKWSHYVCLAVYPTLCRKDTCLERTIILGPQGVLFSQVLLWQVSSSTSRDIFIAYFPFLVAACQPTTQCLMTKTSKKTSHSDSWGKSAF